MTVLIFDLKNNHGWKDKVELDIDTGGHAIRVWSGPDEETIKKARAEILASLN